MEKDKKAIELSDRFRKVRRAYQLTPTEHSIYLELISIWKEEDCPEEFFCSNSELCSSVGIVEKTLINARKNLVKAKLIEYKQGIGPRKPNLYSFVKM